MNAISLEHAIGSATSGSRQLNLVKKMIDWRPVASTEGLTLLCSVFFSLFCNRMFWQAATEAHSPDVAATWVFISLCFITITAVHFVLISLVATARTIRPLLTVLIITTALAAYYMQTFTLFLDATMLRNVLHTELKEARELLTPGLVLSLLIYTALPVAMLWRCRVVRRPWPRAIIVRGLALVAGIFIAAGSLWINYSPMAALWRNQPQARYLITPANYLSSMYKVIFADVKARNRPRTPVGTDASLMARSNGAKPRLLLIVVGETMRAANWGLNGYSRQTTPELAALNVVNFGDVTSCGSNTEVSVPCMFSQIGRRNYNEDRIRSEESLLHVLERAGIKTLWRDNQTGCKGVCANLAFEQLNDEKDPALCKDGLCFDEILLRGLDQKIQTTPGDMVIVLHQLGNHGPAYYLRYPDDLRRYTPTCDSAELGHCTAEQVVNTYDNATLYTDRFLAKTIELLKQSNGHETAMIYISDHGESLGESGLYLHGLPYAIAPKEQTKVPMVMWFSENYAHDAAMDLDCLREQAKLPASQDNLFHTVLGLSGVSTKVYDAALDVTAHCREHRVEVALNSSADVVH